MCRPLWAGWVCWGIQGLGPCGSVGEGVSHRLVPILCLSVLCPSIAPHREVLQWFLWGFIPWAQTWDVEGQTQEERLFACYLLWWDNAAVWQFKLQLLD